MSIVFSRKELANIKYDAERGFCHNGFYFDSLIGPVDTCLSLAKSIHTTEGVVITWVICEGWIVLPLDPTTKKVNYTQFMPLALYLNDLGVDVTYQRQSTCKEQLIDEYIETLQDRIQTLKSYLIGEDVPSDVLVFIAKEHSHPQTKTTQQLLVALKRELNSWYIAKRKVMEYGTFDSTPIVTHSPSNYYY